MENAQPATAGKLDIGGVLSRTFATLKKNPGVFFGLAAAAVLPPILLEFVIPTTTGSNLLMQILDMVLSLAIQGSIAYAVFYAFQGKTAAIGDALSHGMARLGVLFLAALLMGIGIAIGLVLLIIPGVILACVWAVTIPACVVERLGVIDSLNRSMELTKGYRLSVFALMLITNVAIVLVTMLVTAVVAVILPNPIVIALLLVVALTFLQAFNSVMTAIIYYDLRVLKEGISIDTLVSVFD